TNRLLELVAIQPLGQGASRSSLPWHRIPDRKCHTYRPSHCFLLHFSPTNRSCPRCRCSHRFDVRFLSFWLGGYLQTRLRSSTCRAHLDTRKYSRVPPFPGNCLNSFCIHSHRKEQRYRACG